MKISTVFLRPEKEKGADVPNFVYLLVDRIRELKKKGAKFSYKDYEFYKSLLPADLTADQYEKSIGMISKALGI